MFFKLFQKLRETDFTNFFQEKVVIIERMIKCNHPQFGNDNKERLEDLFRFLLQYIHDSACFEDENDFEMKDTFENEMKVIQGLTPFLFDLAKFSPQPSGEAIRSVLQEKYDDYSQSSRVYPTFESVSLL